MSGSMISTKSGLDTEGTPCIGGSGLSPVLGAAPKWHAWCEFVVLLVWSGGEKACVLNALKGGAP
jgi:hypothetical protein